MQVNYRADQTSLVHYSVRKRIPKYTSEKIFSEGFVSVYLKRPIASMGEVVEGPTKLRQWRMIK